ncbi:MAG: hypothetical protein L6U99_13530 [Clostridium sp.]|nr:MAG: hypothetical protein L6U99_13530 [Clostridium sp.]
MQSEIKTKLTKETKKAKDEEKKAFKKRLNALIEEAYSEIDVKSFIHREKSKDT